MRLSFPWKISSKCLGPSTILYKFRCYLPGLKYLPASPKKLSNLREDAQDSLVKNGLAVPILPLWGKNNNSEIFAAYQHEMEGFSKTVTPYFPRASKTELDISEPCTPSDLAGPSTPVTRLPPLTTLGFRN